MKTENSVKFTSRDVGLILDESAGSADTLNIRTIQLAVRSGFIVSAGNQTILDRVENEDDQDDDTRDDDSQALSEMADDAIDFLNSLEVPEFCHFFFEDNSLFLLPNVEDARESVEFTSVKSLREARALGIETDPNDSSYPPADYRGLWLYVSDHGNATLYDREENGNDREVWSIV